MRFEKNTNLWSLFWSECLGAFEIVDKVGIKAECLPILPTCASCPTCPWPQYFFFTGRLLITSPENCKSTKCTNKCCWPFCNKTAPRANPRCLSKECIKMWKLPLVTHALKIQPKVIKFHCCTYCTTLHRLTQFQIQKTKDTQSTLFFDISKQCTLIM